MKIMHLLSALMLASVATTDANAQAPKSVLIDSVNRQVQRSAKLPKAGNATAARSSSVSAATKSGSSANTKAARVVAVPAITTRSNVPAPIAARDMTSPDSGMKTAPPVRRAARVAKTKPPAQ